MSNPRDHLNQLPTLPSQKLMLLRELIFQTASEHDLGSIEESLKWGEPSYNVYGGSPIRIDWKAKTPDHYYLYFNCSTRLVDTFRELFGEQLNFQGNRAIILEVIQPLPRDAIKTCIRLALTYHKVKHLPLLGE
tara:strand:+ start:2165 stop:2566 length:402 start_codon:yes stop_codon:yes gene_type:complete